MKPKYIEVSAGVRYWEDSIINGKPDEDGTMTPFRKGESWCPVIRLSDGMVMDWPTGTTAEIHFKVCDDGEYWLQDADRKRVAKWGGYYVPDRFLCHGSTGYGDYIIFSVASNGLIEKWREHDFGGMLHGWDRIRAYDAICARARAVLASKS